MYMVRDGQRILNRICGWEYIEVLHGLVEVLYSMCNRGSHGPGLTKSWVVPESGIVSGLC